jgi:hypothetical protein
MSADCKGEKPMSKSAQSLFVFSIYLFTLGLILLIIPNFLLSIFSVPETQEVWIRVVGMLVIILGYFDFQGLQYRPGACLTCLRDCCINNFYKFPGMG